MINKYWAMLKWLTEHKMGGITSIICVLVSAVFLPFVLILIGLVVILEHGYVQDFFRNIGTMVKGGKNIDFR